jgi:microcystin-dependent protein
MSVTNSFSSGSTIASSAVNANFTDVASEITGSLPRNGEAAMTGQLKAASGTVLLPGVCFSSDTDCGLYRIGADNIGFSLAGAKVLDLATTGLAVTGTLSSTGAMTSGGALAVTGAITATTTISATGGLTGMGAVPIGAIADYAGSSAPSGWLLCYGQAVSRTTYASLFSAISTTYGTGDGSTTFNVPDCRGRVSAGKDDMGGTSANRLTDQTDGLNGDTLGDTGGTETQAYTQQGTFTSATPSSNTTADGFDGGSSVTAGDSSHTHATTISGTTVAGNNVQPTIIFNKIIYTGVA